MSGSDPGGPYAAGFLRGLGRRLGELLGGEREPGPVNHISLGAHCQMAQVLKTLGLRTWSGPFDWIFTMPGMVRDCLADDFAALVDRTQLETIPEAERRGEGIWRGRHRLYRERYGLECVFNHHDPAADDADHRFLTEGVRRLRAALANPVAENRFWLLTHLHTPPEVVADICDVLARRGRGNHLTFLQHVPGSAERRVVAAEPTRPDLRWFTVETPSASVGLRLADPVDDAFLVDLIAAESRRPREASP